MAWNTTFVIYRLEEGGNVAEVYQSSDLKQAKYWLTYIAQPGDVLCKTPLHPKHSQKSELPEYWGHKEQSGQTSMQEQTWIIVAQGKNPNYSFPTTQKDDDTSSKGA